jgi:CRP/FNR family transcriptional regulator
MSEQARIWRWKPSKGRLEQVPKSARTGNDRLPRLILQPGQHLLLTGTIDRRAYIVRAGSLKSYRIHRDGEEQILGMHGPGDVLGFDALSGRPASSSVVALEIASVESIILEGQDWPECSAEVARVIDGMHRELQKLARMLQMDRHPAERRLAEFLIDFSRSEGERGKSRHDLSLPLNRRDLARFLGLAPETLSRTFTRFQETGVLAVENRRIRIVDFEGLERAAGE